MEKLEELKQYTLEEYEELLHGNRINTDYRDKDGEIEYSTYKDTIFAIPDFRVPRLYHELEPYIKKAKKFNIPYTLEEIGKVDLKDDENKEQHCIIIKLEFSIQLNGWKFIASIDHTSNGNIIRNISGVDLPEKFRTVESYCEHCHTDRRRKSTYVVYNDTDGFKQVGKSCLFLYTGIDLSKIASAMDIWNYIHKYSEISGDEYEDYGYGHRSSSCDAIEVLTLAWKLINIFGYVKKGSNAVSTMNRYCEALDYLDGSMKRYQEKRYKEYSKFLEENNIKFFTDEDFENADKVREWIMEQKVTSDYMNNLHVIFSNFEEGDRTFIGETYHYKTCYMDKKYRAMVVSAVQCYIKAMGIKAERELKQSKERTESNYIGEVGGKVSFKIKDVSVISSWENTFGYHPITNFIYKIVDENGNICTWKTAKVIPVDKVLAKTFTLTGTVKEHSEYKGIKQTELTRCKIN